LAVALLAGVLAAGARGANKNKKAPEPPAGAAGVPADLNDLSLRVDALRVIYELDLSVEQLQALKAACDGTAEVRERFVAKAKPELAGTLKELHEALLKGEDPAKIYQLKDKADELKDDESSEVDDVVRVTEGARGKTAAVFKLIKAGQVAAYVAEHADEVTDPVEQMMDVLADVRSEDAEDPDGEIEDTAVLVSRLVAGLDAAKGDTVAGQVREWLKGGRELKEEAFAQQREGLEAGAKKIVGDVPAFAVLEHWMQNEVATLLSNPQLGGAIDAMIAAKKK
jgi:hypothetical protein